EDTSELAWRPAIRAHRQRCQPVQHIGVAADVPAWLQSDLVMRQADRLYAAEVGVIEAAGEQPLPVRRLRLLQSGNLLPEHALQMRFGGDVPVEVVENPRQVLLDDRPECSQRCACPGVKTEEARSCVKI